MRSEKEAAEALAASRATEIATLQTELDQTKAESERRYRIGIGHQRRFNEVKAESVALTTTVAELRTEIANKDAEIATAKSQLEEEQSKLADLQKKLTESEAGSQKKDATVSRLQSELATAKQSASATPAPTTDTSAALVSLDPSSPLPPRPLLSS